MIPQTDQALRYLAQRLMTQILPDLATSYSASDGMMIALLMNAVADELEAGIDRRFRDIHDMLAVLRAGGVDPAAEQPDSLTLTSVNALHDQLTRQLIALHTAAEEAGNETLTRAIWAYYGDAATRHAVTAVP